MLNKGWKENRPGDKKGTVGSLTIANSMHDHARSLIYWLWRGGEIFVMNEVFVGLSLKVKWGVATYKWNSNKNHCRCPKRWNQKLSQKIYILCTGGQPWCDHSIVKAEVHLELHLPDTSFNIYISWTKRCDIYHLCSFELSYMSFARQSTVLYFLKDIRGSWRQLERLVCAIWANWVEGQAAPLGESCKQILFSRSHGASITSTFFEKNFQECRVIQRRLIYWNLFENNAPSGKFWFT